jgi:hypothetical protein
MLESQKKNTFFKVSSASYALYYNIIFIECLILQIEAENMLATGLLLSCLCEAVKSISGAQLCQSFATITLYFFKRSMLNLWAI